MDLTDQQWKILEPLLPERDRRRGSPGRPRRSAREVLDGVLWILRTGAQWGDLPGRYPPYQTCHRRYQQWVDEGVMERMLRALAEDLRDRGKLDLTEGFIDGTHAGAKKGGLALEKLVAGRPPRSWQSQTAMVFLSPLSIASGQRHEVTLVDETLDAAFLDELPQRLIGDKAYDSVRVAAEPPTARYPLRTPARKLPGLRAARLSRHPAQTVLNHPVRETRPRLIYQAPEGGSHPGVSGRANAHAVSHPRWHGRTGDLARALSSRQEGVAVPSGDAELDCRRDHVAGLASRSHLQGPRAPGWDPPFGAVMQFASAEF